jgi:sugar/nucleoside kinase (ribokinase family)
VLVCALGDLALDVLVRLGGPVASGGDVDAEIVLAPGGQAANVAAWAAELGARSRFLGKRGDDAGGRLAREALAARGVDVLGPATGRGAVVCSLVAPDGERSMASDRGAAAELRLDEIDPRWLEGCDHLFVSGYALRTEPSRAAAVRAVELARAEGAGVSVDLSSWIAIRDAGSGRFRDAVAALAPDAVFANEDEERTLGGPLPGTTWILKRGARGCSFAGDERPALPVERVVDATGAGDALAAGWIVGGPDLALDTAARCVARLGSMP